MKATFGFAVLFLAALTACSPFKSANNNSHRMLSAPQSESQTGYLIDLSDESDNQRKIEGLLSTLEAKGGKIRSINPRHGLYEVYGLSSDQIGQTVPHSQFHKNVFSRKKQQQPRLVIQNFCHKIPTAPQPYIQAQVGGKLLNPENPQLVNRNNPQGFSARVQFSAGQPSYWWEVFPPVTSIHKGRKVTTPDVQIKPDELGEYEVYLVVKISETNACIRGLMFGVTDNAPYQAPTQSQPLPVPTRLAQFPHMNALGLGEAWKFGTGFGVKIAILDTGVDYNHVDIGANIAVNTREVANGRDDDENQFPDDNVGWDFVNNDNMPYDDDLHGTHVAGLSGSLVGVAPNAKILPVKVLGPFGGDMGSLAGAIYYAVDAKARIINMSLGGETDVPSLSKALTYASDRGVLVVVAAGNDSIDIDFKPMYPASYTHPTVLTVAATDLMGGLTDYSNVGRASVDLAAPGGSESDGGLISTLYKNRLGKKYIPLQGTSMATPVVAGVAAILFSARPTLTALQVKSLLMSSGAVRTDYAGKVASQRFVNVNAALLTLKAPRLIPALD